MARRLPLQGAYSLPPNEFLRMLQSTRVHKLNSTVLPLKEPRGVDRATASYFTDALELAALRLQPKAAFRLAAATDSA